MSLSEKFASVLAKIVKENPKGRPMKGSLFFPDPTPVAPPIGYVKQPSMVDIIRDQVRRHASEFAQSQGFESFEEADDFEVDDDYDPKSPYEMIVEQAVPDGPISRPEHPAAVQPGLPGQPGVQGAEPPAVAPGASPGAVPPGPEGPASAAPSLAAAKQA